MNIQRQTALILICWVWSFWAVRWEFSNIVDYQLNKNAVKKRKKGMTLKEWFLYTRYREEIPKLLLFLYFVIVIGHPLVLAICFLLFLLGPYPEIGGNVAKDLLIKVKWKFQNIEFEKKGIRNQAAEQFKIERAAGQGGIWYRFRPVSVCLDKQLPRRNKYAGTC